VPGSGDLRHIQPMVKAELGRESADIFSGNISQVEDF
jgi:hypothetical protein